MFWIVLALFIGLWLMFETFAMGIKNISTLNKKYLLILVISIALCSFFIPNHFIVGIILGIFISGIE
jgi:hypothetical protein